MSGVTKIGTAAINVGTKDETWGLTESLGLNNNGEKKEFTNGQGDIVGAAFCGEKTEIDAEYTAIGDFATARGALATFQTEGSATLTGHVDSVEKQYKKAPDCKTIKVKATNYPNLGT